MRSILMLVSGGLAAQAITLACAPFITRMYGPEFFGVQSLFLSFAGILGSIAAFTYPLAIVLPCRDLDAVRLGCISVALGVAGAALVFIGLEVFGGALDTVEIFRQIAPYKNWLPVFMFFSALAAVASNILYRKGNFSRAARLTALQSIVINSGKLILGIVQPSATALISVNVLGVLICAKPLTDVFWGKKQSLKIARLRFEFRVLLRLLRRYKDFAFLRTPQVLINSLAAGAPTLMLAHFFQASSVGFFAIATAVLAVPSTILGSAVGYVFYPRISSAVRNKENSRRILVKTTLFLGITAIPPFLLIVVFGPKIFSFVFGPTWIDAGKYAQWLAVWLYFQYVNKPCVSAIPVLGLQKGLLMYEVISTFAKVFSLFLGYKMLGTAVASVAFFSIIGAVMYIPLIVWVVRRCPNGKAPRSM